MSIRILLAEDHTVLRHCLRAVIEAEPGFAVVEETDNGRTAIDLARRLSPDVVVMDLIMPELNGIDATAQIVNGDGGPRVLALSMHHQLSQVQKMLEAGATGYLVKQCPLRELLDALRHVAAGRSYFSAEVSEAVLVHNAGHRGGNGDGNGNGKPRRGGNGKHARHAGGNGNGNGNDRAYVAAELTSREREVLQAIAEGYSTKQIAISLSLSVKTIETHRQRMMNKLEIHNIADLTKFAIREGLTTLELAPR